MYHSFVGIVCCCCRLNKKDRRGGFQTDVILGSPEAAWKHLKEHIYAGHKVPKYASDRLKEEIENDRRSRNK